MHCNPYLNYVSRYIVAVPNFYSLVSEPEDGAFQRWELFHKRILSLCERIWVEIKDVLCVDSPEGHTEDTSEDLIVGPKDILSYSWRALRESRYVHSTSIVIAVLTLQAYFFTQFFRIQHTLLV